MTSYFKKVFGTRTVGRAMGWKSNVSLITWFVRTETLLYFICFIMNAVYDTTVIETNT